MAESYEVSRKKLHLVQLNNVTLICPHSLAGVRFHSLPCVSLDFQSAANSVEGLVTLKTATEPGFELGDWQGSVKCLCNR
ncbi:hypothetical protein TNCV_1961351 [Trichonephila clavipes]|nr:hypothetical protein TNCV_1961351 [Trichonephila clavipes]